MESECILMFMFFDVELVEVWMGEGKLDVVVLMEVFYWWFKKYKLEVIVSKVLFV